MLQVLERGARSTDAIHDSSTPLTGRAFRQQPIPPDPEKREGEGTGGKAARTYTWRRRTCTALLSWYGRAAWKTSEAKKRLRHWFVYPVVHHMSRVIN
jgi:hypothetical protein